jgi:oxepin-CoA hydrolase/3-oxo-5,6-dehydrosuberyl-CoA semialdehyde dehydrogenase
MQKLANFVLGKWIEGDGEGQILYHAVTGQPLVTATSNGLDFSSILDFARNKGNKTLRKMTFQERGRMLRALALYLMERKEKFG